MTVVNYITVDISVFGGLDTHELPSLEIGTLLLIFLSILGFCGSFVSSTEETHLY
jgi:hypothetical protein